MKPQTVKPLPIHSLEKFCEANKQQLLQKVSGSIKLLAGPEEYANGAIAELERQLANAKSPNKRAKLRQRIEKWKKTLNVIGEEDGTETDK